MGTAKRSATHPSNVRASRTSSSPFVTGITDTDRRLNTMRMTSSLLLMFGVHTLETIQIWQCVDWGNIEVKRDFRRTGMRTDLMRWCHRTATCCRGPAVQALQMQACSTAALLHHCTPSPRLYQLHTRDNDTDCPVNSQYLVQIIYMTVTSFDCKF